MTRIAARVACRVAAFQTGVMTFTVEALTIPATIDAADAAAFVESIALRNEIEAAGYGTRDLWMEPAEMLPGYHDPENSPRQVFLARVDGVLAGRAFFEANVDAGTPVAWAVVEVLPEYRRRGIGTALAELVESLAAGRERLYVYVVSPAAASGRGDGDGAGAGERLVPPTGFGSVPSANPEVRFLRGRGYTLEQVERASRLALPLDDGALDRQLAAASAVSGDDYRVHRWIRRTPDRWLDDMALLYTRMSTDAPSAGLEEPEDVWTRERVLAAEERERASPREMITVAVEHVPSGRLAGYSSLSVPPQLSRAVMQDDTLVLREHRGRRLGMLLKIANLVHLRDERPGHPSVITFNAEENRHMLQVNEDVGFVPIGYEGAWQKRLG
jgi:GNAT superfamily N-acetyltransferase